MKLTLWPGYLLLVCLLLAPQEAIGASAPICVGEPNPGPVTGPIPQSHGLAILQREKDYTLSPGPAPVLLRMCMIFRSYEVNVITGEQREKNVVAPGSCIDVEKGRSFVAYTCEASDGTCDGRQAHARYCRIGKERKVTGRYWAGGFWAPYTAFEKAKKDRGAFQLPDGLTQTTLAFIETPATYEICGDGIRLKVDDSAIDMRDRCAFVKGRLIIVERAKGGSISGTFTRIAEPAKQ